MSISNKIKDGTYIPKPSRVIHILKPGTAKIRRLIINSPKDKIIQEGIRGIL